MENSSNALLMAGLILIGIIILTVFVTVFANTGNFAKNIEDGITATQVQKFNNQFEKFFPYNEATKQYEGKGADIVSLMNLATEVNTKEGIKVVDIWVDNASCLTPDGMSIGRDQTFINNLIQNIKRASYVVSTNIDVKTGKVYRINVTTKY